MLAMAWNSVSEILSSCSQPGHAALEHHGIVELRPNRLTRGGKLHFPAHGHRHRQSLRCWRWYRALPAREERPFDADMGRAACRGWRRRRQAANGGRPAYVFHDQSLEPLPAAHAADLERRDAGGRGRPRPPAAHARFRGGAGPRRGRGGGDPGRLRRPDQQCLPRPNATTLRAAGRSRRARRRYRDRRWSRRSPTRSPRPTPRPPALCTGAPPPRT